MYTYVYICYPHDSPECSLKEDKHAMVGGIIEKVAISGRQREYLKGRG